MGDIDTVMVDSLKALDPERPIRQADIAGSLSRRLLLTRCVRTARALTAVPGAKAKIKSSSKVLVAAVRRADPVSHGDSILWTAEALESVGYRLSGPVMRKTADVARRASNAGTRERAFDFLLRQPKGRDWVQTPIHDRLVKKDFQGVIDAVGSDQPFVDSPNLYLWRSIAFSQLGQIQRAIEDVHRFVTSARSVEVEIFAFYDSLLRETGDASKLADAEEMARTRLSATELERFRHLIAN